MLIIKFSHLYMIMSLLFHDYHSHHSHHVFSLLANPLTLLGQFTPLDRWILNVLAMPFVGELRPFLTPLT
jgi:hypothetical protein